MNDTLQILLSIYSVLLLINIAVSAVMWRVHKYDLFKDLLFVWSFSLLNFILQGIFMKPGVGMYISFSTYLLVSLSLYQFSCFTLKKNPAHFVMISICSFLFLTGLAVIFLFDNYEVGSAFSALAIAIPMFTSSYQLWISKVGRWTKVFASLLFFNALHFLDYPILRSHPTGAIWGFSIALFILFSFSAFFPSFILLQIAKNYSNQLEQDVSNRTIELEEALAQNKTLVNILCHDLSTPLTVLDFYFEEVEVKGGIGEGQKDQTLYGEKAKRSLKTLFEIVNKVKDLQTISFSKKKVELEKVCLQEIIVEVARSFEDSLSKKNLIINLPDLTRAPIYILGDKELLKNQIFANLISNAIKFSHQNSSIDISLDNDVLHTTITVADHGIGIPPEILNRIFKWSEQTNRLGTNLEKGTGFGLPLVKTCVDIIGARIRVESQTQGETNTGSKFIIQFDKCA